MIIYKIKRYFFIPILFLLYAYLVWLMIEITLQYIPIQTDVAFLSIKQDYIHLIHYRIAFFIHVFSSIFVLFAGFTQFSKKIRIKYPRLHQYMGWIYVGFTLLLSAPTGFIIGIYANGGLVSQIAFCLLAILWAFFTIMATIKIIQRKIVAHQIWMIRSFSLALSAITLRVWKYILVALFHPKPMDVYQIVAWLGWVLNLFIAEIIILNNIKMKRNIGINLMGILLFFISACGDAKKQDNKQVVIYADTLGAVDLIGYTKDSIYGYYVGPFNIIEYTEEEKLKFSNKINISIDSIISDSMYGHSVVAGNSQKFKGKFFKRGGSYIVEANELGNDKYNGVFKFTLTSLDNKITGTWKPYNKEFSEMSYKYDLEKRIFQYDPTKGLNEISSNIEMPVYDSYNEKTDKSEAITADASKINASTHLLTKKDIENMYKRDLEIMRNAIYARHGYSFKNRVMRDFFDNYVDWYIPVSIDVTNELTELEKKNIELIKRYENHAATYYDKFGR